MAEVDPKDVARIIQLLERIAAATERIADDFEEDDGDDDEDED